MSNTCNICGANYEYRDGKWICSGCDAIREEEITNEEVVLLSEASKQLRLANFDYAEELFQDFVKKYPKNSEGYWFLLLTKYGIKYEDDLDGKKIPTIYATSIESVLEDKYYKKALELADKNKKKYYKEEAEKFENIRKEWVEKASKQKPVDIFICFKDSDKENGIERTDDSYEANNLYNHLKDLGYNVFFSRETLRDKVAEKYEPYIFNALNTAHVMVIYSTSKEYVESTWVKNEWNRFLKKIKNGEKQPNSLVLAFDKFNPSELKGFSSYQCMDANKKTFYGDLEKHIAKVIKEATKPKAQIERVEIKSATKKTAKSIKKEIEIRELGTYKVEQLTADLEGKQKTALKFLSKGLFEEALQYFDEILDKNPNNNVANCGKILAQNNCMNYNELIQKITDFSDLSLLETYIAYSNKEDATDILHSLEDIVINDVKNKQYENIYHIINFALRYKYENSKILANITDINSKLCENNEYELMDKINDVVLMHYSENTDDYLKHLEYYIEFLNTKALYDSSNKYCNEYFEIYPQNSKVIWLSIRNDLCSCNDDEVAKNIYKFNNNEKIINLLESVTTKSQRKECIYKIFNIINNGYKQTKNNAEDYSRVFDELLKFTEEKDEKVVDYIYEFAQTCQINREFNIAEKYYSILINENGNSHEYYWKLLQCKLKSRNNDDLIKQPIIISSLPEFQSAIVAAGDDVAADKYIDIKVKQNEYIENQKKQEEIRKKKKKRRIIASTILGAIVICLLSTFIGVYFRKEYVNSQSKLLYAWSDEYNGYVVKAGLYYDDKQITIPTYYNNKTVIAIDEYAFQNKSVEVITIPNSLQYIGDYAFEGCDNLALINFTDEITYASDSSSSNSNLRIVFAAENTANNNEPQLKKIGKYAFKGCSSLTIVNLPDTVEQIGEYAFSNCTNLKEFKIPSSLTIIEKGVFQNSFLTTESSISIPTNITKIEKDAFKGCLNLANIYIDERNNIPTDWDDNWYGERTFSNIKYSLPLYFDYQGATNNNSVEKMSVVYGENYQCPTPIRNGYTFDGWYEQPNGLGEKFALSNGQSIERWNLTTGLAIYANWLANTNSIIFNGNGATSGEMSNQQIKTDETKKLDKCNYTRLGYTFVGWSTTANGSIQYLDEVNYIMGPNSTYTLYAVWEANTNEVIFNGNGATSGEMSNQQIKTDVLATLKLNSYERNGYSFAGWSITADGEVEYANGANYTMGTNSTYNLYAVWSVVTYNINYELNGGIVNNVSNYNVITETFTLNNPTKTGYKFVGWTGSNGNIPQENVSIELGSYGHKSFIANYEANTNEVIFNGNGATSGEMSNQQIKTDSIETLKLNSYERNGYSFAGWSTTVNGEVEYADGVNYTMGTNSAYTLYAVWSVNTYNISYELNNGINNIDNRNSYTVETTTFDLYEATREYYTFDGWYDNSNFDGDRITQITIGTFGNIQLYAKWNENAYFIRTVDDLRNISNDLSGTYVLENNLDLEGSEWTPIGVEQAFTGTLDGQNYIISNFKITERQTTISGDIIGSQNFVGLFGRIQDSCIKNIKLSNININYSGTVYWMYLGGLVGCVSNSTIDNCEVNGSINISSYTTMVGGIAGKLNNQSTISYCKSFVNIESSVKTTEQYSYESYLGGIVGTTEDSQVSCCYANKSIIESNNQAGYVGGIVGKSYNTYISNSYSTNNLSGRFVGGIVGSARNSNINNCYSTGDITANSTGASAAGIVAGCSYTNINNCFSLGKITAYAVASAYAGNITANNTNTATILNCYYIEGQIITAEVNPEQYATYVVSEPMRIISGTRLSYNALLQQINSQWDSNIWELSTETNPQLKQVNNYYKILYILNNGINNYNNKIVALYGENITLYPATRSGYTFLGWFNNLECIGETITSLTINSNIMVYAKWEANTNEIIFNGNGATSGEMSNQQIKTDETKALTNNSYVRTGYTFLGWSTIANGEVEYVDGANYTMGPNSTYTLYAIWEANTNEVIFNGNNATSGEMSNQQIKTDETKTLTNNLYVRTGYTFLGWSTTANGEVEYIDGASYTMGTNSTYTLYAVWSANTNEVIFNGNNATFGEMSNQQIKTDETKTLTNNSYVRTGYTFLGWSTTANGEVEYIDGASYTMGTNSTYTLYAVWEEKIREIYTYNDFKSINEDYLNDNIQNRYILKNDINLQGNEIVQISNFRSIFEGNNFKIYNFTQTKSLFDINDGEIRDLTVSDFTLSKHISETRNMIISSFVGVNNGKISNCIIDGVINITGISQSTTNTNQVSLVVGTNNSIITNTTSRGIVNGIQYASGFVCENNSIIKNCYSTAKVYVGNIVDGSCNMFAAGFAIFNRGGEISNCYSSGDVTIGANSLNYYTYSAYASGFLALRTANINGTLGLISNCFSLSNVYIYVNSATSGYASPFSQDVLGGNGQQFVHCYMIEEQNVYKVVTYNSEPIYYKTSEQSYSSNLMYINKNDLLNKDSLNNMGFANDLWKFNEQEKRLYLSYESNIKLIDSHTNNEKYYKTRINSTFKLNNPFEYNGYTCIGWSTTANGEVEYVTDYTFNLDSEYLYTFYSVWSANTNHVIFNGNGATSGEMSNQQIKTDETKALTNNLYVRTGYTFLGWSTTANGEVEYVDGANYTMGPNSNYTLYAVWEANTNEVIFNGNNATSGEMANQQIKTDETKALTNNLYVRTGYTFLGWSKTANGEVEYVDGANYTMSTNSTYTLYAVWEITIYSINYHLNGGEIKDNISNYTINSDTINLVEPTRDGYSFAGWYIDENFEQAIDKIEHGSYGNKDVYAKWSIITYSITYNTNGGINDERNPLTYTIESDEITLYPANFANEIVSRWYLESSFTNRITTIPTGSFGDITIFARSGYDNNDIYIIQDNDLKGINKDFITEFPITTLTIPNTVTKITDCQGPLNKNSITKIIIPNSVTYIQDTAFAGYNQLEEITLPFVGQSISADAYKSVFGYIFGYYTTHEESDKQEISTEYTKTTTGSVDNAINQYNCYNYQYSKTNINEHYYGLQSYWYYIPTTIKTVTITNQTTIPTAAFCNCSFIETINLPNNLEELNAYSFSGCESLKSAFIPSGMKKVMESTFRNCKSLTEINIPNSVINIGAGAFRGCESLINIALPNQLQIIDEYAFYNCMNLTTINLPTTLQTIGSYSLCDCSKIKSIVIPDSVTTIGVGALKGTSLEEITLPFVGNKKNSTYSAAVFGYIFGFESVANTGTSNTFIEASSGNFEGLTNQYNSRYSYWYYIPTTIKTVTITNQTTLPTAAFYNCSFIETINLPNSLTTISSYSLAKCGFNSIIIPDSVTTIEVSALKGTSLEEITLPFIYSRFGYIFGYEKTYTTSKYQSSKSGFVSEVTGYVSNAINQFNAYEYSFYYNSQKYGLQSYWYYIPTTIKKVTITKQSILSEAAFYNCSFIETLVLPKDITINQYAFDNCTSIQNIYYNGTIEDWCQISGLQYLMSNGSDIKQLYINNELIDEINIESSTTISAYAFAGCASITSISISDNVTNIGENAFAGCLNLEYLEIPFVGNEIKTENDEYQFTFGYVFGTKNYGNDFYSISQTYYTTKKTDGTFNSATPTYYIPIKLTGLKVTGGNILYGAFKGCNKITNIVIPNNITSIGDYAFYGCSGLENLNLNQNINSIGSYAFYNCQMLSEIQLSSQIKKIYTYTFYNCKNLLTLDIPAELESIGTCAFQNCEKLNNIILPNTISAIPNSAFYNCKSLETINLPNSVTSIGNYAFYGCKLLDNVTLPTQLQSIGSYAFQNCINLSEISLGPSITVVNSYTFSGCSNLSFVNLSDSIQTIGSYAFQNCSSLSQIYLPTSLQNIYGYAFSGCSSITKIIIPDSVTTIEIGALKGTSLEEITLPFVGKNITATDYDSVFGYIFGYETTSGNATETKYTSSTTSVVYSSETAEDMENAINSFSKYIDWTKVSGSNLYSSNKIQSYWYYIPTTIKKVTITNQSILSKGSFKDCYFIETIILNNKLTAINQYAFEDCSSLENIYFDGSVDDWCQITGLEYLMTSGGSTINLYINEQLLTEATITSATTINAYAFNKCKSITKLVASPNLLTVNSYAFKDCESLREVSLPDSVTSISEGAFQNCYSLYSITIPASVSTIGSYAFQNCYKLVEVINLSNSFTNAKTKKGTTSNGYVWYYAQDIYDYNDENIESNVYNEGDFIFLKKGDERYLVEYIGNSEDLVLPTLEYNYKIYPYAFINNQLLETITIPSSVVEIGKYAFKDCSNITGINVNVSVISIGEGAFSGCSNLENVYYTGTLDNWCEIIFENEYSNPLCFAQNLYINNNLVEEIVISSATKINSYAFYNYKKASNATIGASVVMIGKNAFKNCSIEEVEFADEENWYIHDSETSASTLNIRLNNVSYNATYLTNTYLNKVWKKHV